MADVHNAGSVEEDMEDVSEKTNGLLLNHLTKKFLQAKGPFQGIPTNWYNLSLYASLFLFFWGVWDFSWPFFLNFFELFWCGVHLYLLGNSSKSFFFVSIAWEQLETVLKSVWIWFIVLKFSTQKKHCKFFELGSKGNFTERVCVCLYIYIFWISKVAWWDKNKIQKVSKWNGLVLVFYIDRRSFLWQ